MARIRPEHIHEAVREYAGIAEHPFSKKFPLGGPYPASAPSRGPLLHHKSCQGTATAKWRSGKPEDSSVRLSDGGIAAIF